MAVVDFNFRPSRSDLRMFFGIWLPGSLIVLGLLIAWRHAAVTAGAAVSLSLAVISCVIGWLRPGALWLVYVVWLCLVFPIGWLVSHLVLGLVYFVVFTPIGLVMRLVRYDPMARTFDRQAPTYWTKHEPASDPRSYFRPL
jgi:hypothetical protein